MPKHPSVTTEVPLDTQQIKFLIDAMWSLDPHTSQQISVRHDVSDVELEGHLQKCLGLALSELD